MAKARVPVDVAMPIPPMPILITAAGVTLRFESVHVRTSSYTDSPLELGINRDNGPVHLSLDDARELAAALLQLAELIEARQEARGE